MVLVRAMNLFTVMQEFFGYITAKFYDDLRQIDHAVILLMTFSLLFNSIFEAFYAKAYNFKSIAATFMKLSKNV